MTASGVSRDNYLDFAKTDREVPLMRPGDEYPYGTPAYSIASYDKMSTNMIALRALLGDDAVPVGIPDVWIALAVQASDAIRLL